MSGRCERPKWLIDTQGLDAGVARDQARTILIQLPAWRDAVTG